MSGTSEAFVLPAGTVTFLSSEIEDSARLWETEPEAMTEAAPAVYAILEEAVAAHGGVRPARQVERDAMIAAFARASDALGAALSAQGALRARPWPCEIGLRVRMAIHTAEAQLRDRGNDFGQAAARCTRLRAIAHGGQTLLSRPAHDLVADRLADGAELLDCGAHRLRDLGRPEHVFLVAHPELPVERRPLRSLDTLPNNLPAQLTTFVGRVRELAEADAALRQTRLLTLTGAGGSGKTRLALQVAADALDRFPDGAWWVDLAQLTDPEMVGDAVASAVGVRASAGLSALQVTCAHLASRRALIALDNCEHVLREAATVAGALLSACAEVTVLATSRAPLGVGGETDWRVPPLSLPPRELPVEPIDAVSQCDAVRLFVERARKVRPNFVLDERTAPAVAQICHELDGIPLAIELAAARIRMMTADQISAGLVNRFHLLTGGSRAALPRQHTLRASVDWSHELLSEDERALFRRLGTFVGGFTLDAAEHVGAGGELEPYSVLDLLGSLVEKSLVQAEQHGPLVRYALLETVRQYAFDRLAEADELDGVSRRHLEWFLALAERAAPALETDEQEAWLDALDLDAANFTVALERANPEDPGPALRLTYALTMWWLARGRLAEAESVCDHTLALGAKAPAGPRARVHFTRAGAAAQLGRHDLAREYGVLALELADADGDAATAARALAVIGLADLFADPAHARNGLQRAINLARAAADRWAEIEATHALALACFFQNDPDGCARLLDGVDAVVAAGAPGYQVGRHALTRGLLALWTGDLTQARADFERGSVAARGEPVITGFCEAQLAVLDTLQGNGELGLERASASLEHALGKGAGTVIPVLHISAAWAERSLARFEDAYARVSTWLPALEGRSLYFVAWGSVLRADLARRLGDLATAEDVASHGLAVAKAIGNEYLAGHNRLALGRLAAARQDWAAAQRHADAMLDACAESGHVTFAPDALEGLAEASSGTARPADAARLLAAAARARRDLGTPRSTADETHWEVLVDTLRDALGDEFDLAWSTGEDLSLEQAIAWVRRARGERKRPATGWASLTPTEQRIVELATQGLTNPQIGERMFITRATVKTHLEHIYAKLAIRGRTELAAAATARRRR